MVASTIVSLKMIKPSSPTPPSLRHHNLSLVDYTSMDQYIPVVFFYSKPENCNKIQISHILENSLSKVLSSYYPLAGRIKDNNRYVDCNDIGAEYLTVQINCPMSEILNHPYNDAVDVLFPQDLPWSSFIEDRSPLVVQLSHFDCGGIAVSVCISHKIVDGYSLSRFLNDWACTARDDQLDLTKPAPLFDGSSFFPLMDDPPSIRINILSPKPHKNVSKMFNISSSSLGKLKADIVATNSGVVKNPTRVEVATALVHKCGVTMSMETSGVFKPTLLVHMMNLRPRIPLNTMGNVVCAFAAVAMKEEDINLPNFIAQLQKAKQQLRDELKDMNTNQISAYLLERFQQGGNIPQDMFDSYVCSSFFNFGLYSIDFGWGKPVRVTLPRNPVNNNFVLMDNPSGDGINILITLTEVDMLKFQSNKELLQFASPVVQSTQ